MKLRILFPQYKTFLGKGALPPYNPRQGASPLDPWEHLAQQTALPTIQNGMTPMHKRAQWGNAPFARLPIFNDSPDLTL